MKVLYLSYDGMTDPLGQSQVIPYLQGLSARGHEITLISCEKKDRFTAHSGMIRKLLASSNISWYPVPYSTLPSVISKRLNLSAMSKVAAKICREQKLAVVHCRSYMAALIGLKLKRRYGLKFIFDMRGFWADERIDGNIWSLNNPLHKRIYSYFKRKEIEFLLHADHTISLTENAKDEILSWSALNGKQVPITVIPCCADLDLFSPRNIDPAKQHALRSKLGIRENELVISYLGSIGTWYMLGEMLDFFKCLSAKRTKAKFLFITPDDKSLILREADQKGISADRIIVVSAQRTEVPAYLSLSELSLYFIKPLYSKKASSPTKTAEIMGLGIPIITNSGIGDSDLILEKANAGALINAFTKEEYERVIEQIDVLLKTDKTKTGQAAEKYFSLQKGVEKYAAVYEKLAH
jgi:glycosyltransferase involved in cell wall biosynthesis